MTFRLTRGRALAGLVLCLLVVGLTPAISSACTFPTGDLTYAWTAKVKNLQLRSTIAAITEWSDRTNVNFTQAVTERAPADLILTVADLQSRRLHRPAGEIGSAMVICNRRGTAKRARIYFDAQWVRGNPSFDERRAMIGHEVGHVLGLDHNMKTAGTKCWDGQPRPATLMYPTLVGLGRGVVCGPVVPTVGDVRRVNALYG